jgi:aspartyl-tRNA(Asn)/glutamyl-tRNA(Gln) amidotransferase subunit C
VAGLSRKEIEHVALLARLDLTEEEIERFTGQLNSILEHFNQLNELDTTGIEPTSHAVPLGNVLREDAVTPSLSPEEVLANAPETGDTCFRVPRVVE